MAGSLIAAGLALLPLMAAAPAVAAEWTPAAPQTLAGANAAISVSLGAEGTGFASWGVYRGGVLRKRFVVPVDAEGALGARTSMDPSFSAPEVIDARGRALVVGKRSGHIVWALLGRDGRLGASHVIAGSATDGEASVSGNARGDATIVWCQGNRDRGGKPMLRSIARTKGGPFGAAATLDIAPDCGWAAEALGPSGELAYTSVRDRGTRGKWLYVSVGKIGKGLRSPVLVGSARLTSVVVQAIDGRGRTYVAWRSQKVGGTGKGLWETRVASIAAGGQRAVGARTLERSEEKDPRGGEPVLAASPVAGAIIGLPFPASSDPTQSAVSIAAPDGRFSPPTSLGNPSSLGAIAYRADGVGVVTSSQQQQLVANVVRDGKLGAAEATGLVSGPHRLFFNERSGRPTVVAYSDPVSPTVQLFKSVRVRP